LSPPKPNGWAVPSPLATVIIGQAKEKFAADENPAKEVAGRRTSGKRNQ
jgi:hypothetical protein